MGDEAIHEVDDGRHGLFVERVWPSAGVWLLVPLPPGLLLLSLLPVGVLPAVVGCVALATALVLWAVRSAPVVAVRDGELVAGPARVPVSLLGSATAWRGTEARQQRGPALDPRAYLSIRGWVDPVVRVELTDPADPTPYWLISTRRPEELVAALDRAHKA
ncbi:MAG: DUF3093 domain-containing protein [Actinomycetes bacterium]